MTLIDYLSPYQTSDKVVNRNAIVTVEPPPHSMSSSSSSKEEDSSLPMASSSAGSDSGHHDEAGSHPSTPRTSSTSHYDSHELCEDSFSSGSDRLTSIFIYIFFGAFVYIFVYLFSVDSASTMTSTAKSSISAQDARAARTMSR